MPDLSRIIEEMQKNGELDDTVNNNGKRLRNSLDAAYDTNPDQAAATELLAKKSGMPVDFVERNPEPAQRKVYFGGVPIDELVKDTPTAAEFLSDSTKAKQSHDDIESLKTIEKGWRGNVKKAAITVADVVRSVPGGAVEGIGMGASGIGRAIEATTRTVTKGVDFLLPESMDKFIWVDEDAPDWLKKANQVTSPSYWLRGAGDSGQYIADQIKPPAERQNLATDISGGVGQVAGQIAAMMVNPAAGSAVLFGQGVEQQGQKQDESGLNDPTLSSDAALMVGGAVTMALERVGLDVLVNRIPPAIKNKALRMLADVSIAGGAEAVEETLEGVAQNMIEFANYNPEAQIFEGLEREALAAGGTGAVVRGIINAIAPGKIRLTSQSDQAKLDQVLGGLESSKLNQRNEDLIREYLEALGADTGSDTLFIDAEGVDKLFQNINDPELIQSDIISQLAEQLPDAIESGSKVQIPLSDLPSLVKSGLARDLQPYTTTNIDAMSPAQLQDVDVMAEVAAIREMDAEQRSAELEVFNDVFGQEIARGVDRTRAESHAMLHEAFFRTLARRDGITQSPIELYRRFNPTFKQEIDPRVQAQIDRLDRIDVTLNRLRAGDIPQDVDIFGDTITQFIRKEGGIIDEGGELAARDAKSLIRPNTGRTLDDMAERAVEEGYIDERDINKLIDAIDSDLRGDPVYRLGEENSQLQSVQADLNQLQDLLDRSGIDLNAMTNDEVLDALNIARDIVSDDDRLSQLYSPEEVEFLKSMGLVTDQELEAINNVANEIRRSRLGERRSADDQRRQDVKTVSGNVPRQQWTENTRVTRNGKPAIVYRGSSFGPVTTETFTQMGAATGRPSAQLGVWFTSDVSEATGYGDLYEYHLDIQNPKVYKTSELPVFDTAEEYAALAEQLRADGHDGIAIDYRDVQKGRIQFIPFSPDQVIEPKKEDLLYQFAGVNSDTADISSLMAAVKLSESGQSNRAIYQQTGWFKGVDGRWRYEISDADADWTGNFDILPGLMVSLGEVLDHPALFAAYPNLSDMTVSFVPDSGLGERGAFFPSQNLIEINAERDADAMLSTLLHEVQHSIQELEDFARGGSSDQAFTEAVSEALGRMDDYNRRAVEAWKWNNSGLISDAEHAATVAKMSLIFDSARKLIEYSNHDRPSSVLRHIRNQLDWLHSETIQKDDELRRRSNEIYREMMNLPKRHKTAERNAFLRELSFDAAQLLYDAIPPNLLDQFRADPRKRESMVKQLTREAEKARARLAELRDFEKDSEQAKRLFERYKFESPYRIYRALAGEVEARNTQARLNMTAEERAVSFPESTADVAASDAIVVMNDGAIELPLVARSVNENKQVTDTNEFLKWFGDSKVTNDDGQPLVVYHGTPEIFDAFDPKKAGGHDVEGAGFYFTSDKTEASGYANGASRINKESDNTGPVHEVYLKIENPIPLEGDPEDYRQEVETLIAKANGAETIDDMIERFEQDEDLWWESPLRNWDEDPYSAFEMQMEALISGTEGPHDLFQQVWYDVFGANNAAYMKAMLEVGYDGVILRKESKHQGNDHFIVFDPAAIKSVKNAGTFDALNPNIYEQAKNGGNTDRARGYFNRATNELTFTKDQNLSTFLHESGHFFLEVMREVSKESPSLKRDIDALDAWWESQGAKDDRERHEMFASGFETYLMEGKAPTAELKPIFSRFRLWLTTVYKTITGPFRSNNLRGVELSDEVRGVMDRLLATQNEIDRAQNNSLYGPFPGEALGLTPEQAAEYQALVNDAEDEAMTELTSEVMREYKRETERWWRDELADVKIEVAQEVDALPVYRLRDALTGDRPLESRPNLKLDRACIKAEYGKDIAKKLSRMLGPDGVHPDQLSMMFGYSDGDALVMDLLNSKTKAQRQTFVNGEAEARMKQRHGDMINDGTLAPAAEKAVHNDKQAERLTKELDFLNARAGRKPTPREFFKEAAKQTINSTAIRDIKPHVHRRQELTARTNAIRAAAKGDFKKAASEQHRALRQHYLLKEADRALRDADKAYKFGKSLMVGGRAKTIRKAGDSYIEQVNSILEWLEFKRSTNKDISRKQSMTAWIQKQMEQAGAGNPKHSQELLSDDERILAEAEQIEDPQKAAPSFGVTEIMMATSQTKNYRELTPTELSEVSNMLHSIYNLAKLKDKLLTSQDKRTFNEWIDRLESVIEENANNVKAQKIGSVRDNGYMTKAALKAFYDTSRTPTSLIRMLDGFKDGGDAWELLGKPLQDAATEEASQLDKANKDLEKIFSVYSSGELASMNKLIRGEKVSKHDVLSILLNWGSETGRQRVLDGFRIEPLEVDRLFNAYLDKRDFDFAKSVWKYLETFKKASFELHEDLFGFTPDEVEPAPFESPFGTMPGGYYPIKYDALMSAKAEQNILTSDSDIFGKPLSSKNKLGSNQKRLDTVKRALNTDMTQVIFGHVADVIHSTTHDRALYDVGRILSTDKIKLGIQNNYGDHVYSALTDMVREIKEGGDNVRNRMDRVVQWARNNATLAMLGASVRTVILQPFGVTNSLVKARLSGIGTARLMSSYGKYMSNIPYYKEHIQSKSEYMQQREKVMSAAISRITQQIKRKGKLQKLTELSMIPMQKMQFYTVDAPLWLASYEHSINKGLNEEQAVDLADQAVRDAQGSGSIIDTAQAMRGGPWQKLFTNFLTYMMTTFNLYEESRQARKRNEINSLDHMINTFVLVSAPALLTTMLNEFVDGPDDDEDWYDKLWREQLSFIMSMNPIGAQFSGMVSGFDYAGPQGTALISKTYQLAKQIGQGEADASLMKSLFWVIGLSTGLPAAQFNRTVFGAADAIEESESVGKLVKQSIFGPEK